MESENKNKDTDYTVNQIETSIPNQNNFLFNELQYVDVVVDDTPLSATLDSGANSIVRVQYFVRGGSVGHRSRASSKHLSPHLPVDELDSSGVKQGCAAPADARVGVGSTKKAD
ncbi:hypothetical protein TNCV_3605441 [Trichonephila clavipes]|uniref:Uncharacterized protein n=1 Tax=Trichonephila clavipes TaxID=2585209 RepID=A0A8X6RRC6_TRICX|nr:hypothetical protein TNCV_3605441 [Trichonephila clavipes]